MNGHANLIHLLIPMNYIIRASEFQFDITCRCILYVHLWTNRKKGSTPLEMFTSVHSINTRCIKTSMEDQMQEMIVLLCTHPTVVMEMKDHQNPSPIPPIKLEGNSSGLYFDSWEIKKMKYYKCYDMLKIALSYRYSLCNDLAWQHMYDDFTISCWFPQSTHFLLNNQEGLSKQFPVHFYYCLSDFTTRITLNESRLKLY